MNNIKTFKPYNYFDETKKECNKAMDKIIELYKENESGEELVKHIEKVNAMNHVSPRAKEFLKHGISMIKGR
jgi:5,10-methylene-tetrahydrofolate dehydrogenase/methenyl tetrahydrofolate cyclohydrolase